MKSLKLGLVNLYKDRWRYNPDFWAQPNPINCYFAGFCAADASISFKDGYFGFHLEIHENDLALMEDFKKQIGYDGPIMKLARSRNKKLLKTVKISLRAPRWQESLKKFGIIERKTHRLAPPDLIDPYLAKCYLIGYADGDGTITADFKIGQPSISFTSASKTILDWVFLQAQLMGIQSNAEVFKLKKSEAYRYSLSGKAAIQFFNILKNIDVPKLARKWDNPQFLEIVKKFNDKYPELTAA